MVMPVQVQVQVQVVLQYNSTSVVLEEVLHWL